MMYLNVFLASNAQMWCSFFQFLCSVLHSYLYQPQPVGSVKPIHVEKLPQEQEEKRKNILYKETLKPAFYMGFTVK